MGEEATYHLAAILEWCRCGRGWEPSEIELGHENKNWGGGKGKVRKW